jgi:hypothetical protein
MKPITNENREAIIAELKTRWNDLHVLDRARWIQKITATGMSLRALAKALGRPDSSLRYLLKAAKAPLPDRVLAKNRAISTRELIRRGKAAEAQRKAKEREAFDLKCTEEAQKAAAIITKWLREQNLSPVYGEAIIDEARRIFASTRPEDLPKCAPPTAGTPVAKIINALKLPMNPDASPVAWFAFWLARWAFFAFPDEQVRDKALNMALDAEIRG